MVLGATECHAILLYSQIKEKASAWQKKDVEFVSDFNQIHCKES